MMGRIRALALATIRDGIRSEIFVNLGVFAFFALMSALVLEELALGVRGRVLLDVGLAAVSVVNAMVATFLVIRSMGGEENRQTLLMVLVRPVRRAEVIVGKALGVVLLVCANAFGAAVLLGGALEMVGGDMRPDHLFTAWLGLCCEALLVTAVTILFSTFAGSTVAAVLGLGTYVSGLWAFELRAFVQNGDTGALRFLAEAFYYVVPNLQRLDFHARNPSAAELLGSLTYVLMYGVAVLAAACAVFERRDLK
jgi:ABC-type transport system involved in multi-copper enzyme maturation permease subunit